MRLRFDALLRINDYLVLGAVFVLSLFLSALAVYVDPVINYDAVWYLEVAKVFAQGDITGGIKIDVAYNWPFYSFLIGNLSHFSGFSVDTAAYMLDALFSSITVIASTFIAYEMSRQDRRILLIAAAVFLLLPLVNDYRSFVIRDHGYLAFYTLGLMFFIRYAHAYKMKYAIAWGVSMCLALLFRSEALVFLLLAPVYFMFANGALFKQRLRRFVDINCVLLVLAVFGLILAMYFLWVGESIKLSGLLFRHVHSAIQVITDTNALLTYHASGLSTQLYVHYDGFFLKMLVLVIVATILVSGLFKSVTLPYVAMWWWSRRQAWLIQYLPDAGIWRTFIWLNIGLLSIFVFGTLFVAGRYTLAFVTTFMLCAPFMLKKLYFTIWRQPGHKLAKSIMMVMSLLVVYQNLDIFIVTGPGRQYERDAGLWLSQNRAQGETVYSVSTIVSHYANSIDLAKYKDNPYQAIKNIRNIELSEAVAFLHTSEAHRYNYVALKYSPRKQEHLSPNQLPDNMALVKTFSNKLGDQVAIYQFTNINKPVN